MLDNLAESILNENLFGGGGGISISTQNGYADLANTTSKNITISSVDLSKTIVIISIKGGSTFAAAEGCIMAKLTSTTVLNLSRSGYSVAATPTIYWTVIEFKNIKSLQKGEVSYFDSDPIQKSITVSAVNTKAYMAFVTFKRDKNTQGLLYQGQTGIQLLNSTTIQIMRDSSGDNASAYWYLIEFN
jgi:hypothetical protein